jgi:hypothetical protein
MKDSLSWAAAGYPLYSSRSTQATLLRGAAPIPAARVPYNPEIFTA